MVRESPTEAVDSGLIPSVVTPMVWLIPSKIVFTASLVDAKH